MHLSYSIVLAYVCFFFFRNGSCMENNENNKNSDSINIPSLIIVNESQESNIVLPQSQLQLQPQLQPQLQLQVQPQLQLQSQVQPQGGIIENIIETEVDFIDEVN